MALILKTDNTFTDDTLPILYPDSAMTASTAFVFDAGDDHSWPSQAAPNVNSAWIDLAGGLPATFPTAPGWNNGFTFTGGAAGEKIYLPTTGKIAADQKTGFLAIAWIKPTSVVGIKSVAGLTNGTAASAQWMMYQDGTQFIMASNGAAGPMISGVQSGEVYQIAIGYKGDGNGNFVRSSWKNGALIGKQASHAAASIFQPGSSRPSLGRIDGVQSFIGTIYRCMFDTLALDQAVADIVVKDYADNQGRFA